MQQTDTLKDRRKQSRGTFKSKTHVVGVLVRFAFALRLVLAIALIPLRRRFLFFAGRFFVVAPVALLPPPLLLFAFPLFFQFVRVREPATPSFVIGPFSWRDKKQKRVVSRSGTNTKERPTRVPDTYLWAF